MRLLVPSDAIRLFNLINDNREFIGAHLSWVKNMKTLADEESYVQKRIVGANAKTSFEYTIETLAGDFLGLIGTDPVSEELWDKGMSIDYENKIVSFAYFIDPKFQGNGYITEALDALIKIARALGFLKVQFGIEPENEKSIRVARRAGAVYNKAADSYILGLVPAPPTRLVLERDR